MPAGHLPRHRSTPVVTDQVEPLGPDRIGHRQHITDEARRRIGRLLGRPGSGRVAPLIGSDHPVAGRYESRHLVVPRLGRLGEAVQQQHHLAVGIALDHRVEQEPAELGIVDLDRRRDPPQVAAGAGGAGAWAGAAAERRLKNARQSCAATLAISWCDNFSTAWGTRSAIFRRSM